MDTVLGSSGGQPVIELRGELGQAEAPALRAMLQNLWHDGPDYLVCDPPG